MEYSIRRRFGERLMLLRRRRGLSQSALAQRAQMSVTSLNRVENARQSLYMEQVVALARVLGTSTDYLLGLSTDEGKEERKAIHALE